MYLVIATVRLRPGTVDDWLALFKKTNPGLVADEPDWIGAEFTADREADTIHRGGTMEIGRELSQLCRSDKFRNMMKEFGRFVEAPPEVRISERLWQMGTIA